MKKFTAVFLLLLFLGKTAGIFGLFNFLREKNYESVFSHKPDELNLVKVTVPKTKKINWEKENEIIYEGKYYDVFSKTEDDKNIYLLCYSDVKDNHLAEVLHKDLSDDNKKKSNTRLLEIIAQYFILSHSPWCVYLASPQKISIQIFNPTHRGFVSVFSPPPDFLVC